MAKRIRKPLASIRRFFRSEDGAQLVEFAIMLPLTLLFFTVIVEGGRMMWSYQAANAGVRDATRYLARALPYNYCPSGASVGTWTTTVTTIVKESTANKQIFPSGITVNSVTPSVKCVSNGLRVPSVAVAQVTANITITFPFAGVFQLVGSRLDPITTSISDQSRVFGT